MQQQVDSYKNAYQNLKDDHDQLVKNLKCYFEEDQVKALCNPSHSVREWNSNTIRKAIRIQALGNNRTLNYCRENIAPLPFSRTVQKQLEHFVMSPGVLNDIIDIINVKVTGFSQSALRMGILIDEKALVPGESKEMKKKGILWNSHITTIK